MDQGFRHRAPRIWDRDPQRLEYLARLNRVLDHIDAHLDQPLPLTELARVANFSPFHFHRVFGGLVGEPLRQYVLRLRVERAASQLVANPRKTVTAIALDCGFSGSATFARAFRDPFGMSASRWRGGGWRQGKKRKAVRKQRQDLTFRSGYLPGVDTTGGAVRETPEDPKRRRAMSEREKLHVTVTEMAPFTVAYVRHIGPYKADAQLFEGLFARLMKWAGPRGLMRPPETRVLVVYHDDPNVTDEDKLRISACLSVPDDTPVEGEVGKMTVQGGQYAVARFELGPETTRRPGTPCTACGCPRAATSRTTAPPSSGTTAIAASTRRRRRWWTSACRSGRSDALPGARRCYARASCC